MQIAHTLHPFHNAAIDASVAKKCYQTLAAAGPAVNTTCQRHDATTILPVADAAG